MKTKDLDFITSLLAALLSTRPVQLSTQTCDISDRKQSLFRPTLISFSCSFVYFGCSLVRELIAHLYTCYLMWDKIANTELFITYLIIWIISHFLAFYTLEWAWHGVRHGHFAYGTFRLIISAWLHYRYTVHWTCCRPVTHAQTWAWLIQL